MPSDAEFWGTSEGAPAMTSLVPKSGCPIIIPYC